MSPSISTIKDVAAAFQSIAVAGAIIIGGLWALFRFRALNEIERARAELNQLRRSLQQQASVNVSIVVTVMPNTRSSTRCASIVVSLKNIGSQPEIINWASMSVRSAPMIGFENSSPVLGMAQTTKPVAITPLSITAVCPQITEEISFLVPLENAGLYFAEFIATGTNQREAVIATAGLTPIDRHLSEFMLTTSKFFEVPE
jgi:hypothetical protein